MAEPVPNVETQMPDSSTNAKSACPFRKGVFVNVPFWASSPGTIKILSSGFINRSPKDSSKSAGWRPDGKNCSALSERSARPIAEINRWAHQRGVIRDAEVVAPGAVARWSSVLRWHGEFAQYAAFFRRWVSAVAGDGSLINFNCRRRLGDSVTPFPEMNMRTWHWWRIEHFFTLKWPDIDVGQFHYYQAMIFLNCITAFRVGAANCCTRRHHLTGHGIIIEDAGRRLLRACGKRIDW